MNEKAHPVDVMVGARVKSVRVSKRISQAALATAIGITFQQVQKYERGANRISASRLVDIARCLDVDPGALLSDFATPDAKLPDFSIFDNQRAMQMVHAFVRLKAQEQRAVLNLVEELLGER